MPFYWDPYYTIILIPCIVLSGLTSLWVRSSFAKWSKTGAKAGYTGAQVAAMILQVEGVSGVRIELAQGFLSDHYDPTSKTLRLSPDNYNGRSIAALGVSAHEVGHAIQHARSYALLGFRSTIVPLANIGSMLGPLLIFAGVAMQVSGLTLAGVVLFALMTLFTLVTLPVEFDASRRAMLALEQGGILDRDELKGARAVLRAAASTYVAAALTAVVQLLYYLWRAGLLGGRRSND